MVELLQLLVLEEILSRMQSRGETYDDVLDKFESSKKLIAEARYQKRTKIQWIRWIDRFHYHLVVLKRKKE